MVITIMRQFNAYTVEKLLDMPFAHFRKLFEFAEKAVNLSRYDLLVAECAKYDKTVAHTLQGVERTALKDDVDRLTSVITEENKQRAYDRALKIAEGCS